MVNTMKLEKICLSLCLALALPLTYSIGVNAESLLQKGSQAVMLIGQSDATGVVLLKDFSRVMPNGTTQSVIFPPNTVFIVTHMIWAFAATNTGLNGAAELQIGSYYFDKVTLANGANGDVDNLPGGGIVFGEVPDTCSASVVNLATGLAIPGNLGIRVVGYLAPAQ